MAIDLSLALNMSSLGGGQMDPDAATLLAAMSVQPANYWAKAYNGAIVALKSAGIWPILDSIGFVGGDTLQASLLDWKRNHDLTAHNAPAWLRNQYMTGSTDTAAEWLGLGVNANALSKFTQNSSSLFVWAANPTASGNALAGYTSATLQLGLRWDLSGNAAAVMNSATAVSVANGDAASPGLLLATSNGSSTTLYVNDDISATVASTSIAPVAAEISFLRGLGHFCPQSISWWGIGGFLTAAQKTRLYQIMQTFNALVAPNYYFIRWSGQSHSVKLNSDAIDGGGDSGGSGNGANFSRASFRVFLPILQSQLDAKYTQRANAINMLLTAVGGTYAIPVGATDSWCPTNGTDSGTGFYLAQEDAATAAATIPKKNPLEIWIQGTQEALDNNNSRTALWETSTQLIFAHKAAALPGLKWVMGPINGASATDAGNAIYRAAQDTLVPALNAAGFSTVLSAEMADCVRINSGDYHLRSVDITSNGYDRLAAELAYAAAAQFGCDNAAWRGPELQTNGVITSGTTIDIPVTYPPNCAGTDFSPTTGLVGFIVTDANGARSATAARKDANTITLTVTGSALAAPVTWQYDPTPGLLDPTKMPVDNNAALAMPIRRSGLMAAS